MPLLQLMRVSLDVQTSLALFRRIFEYLDLKPAITEQARRRTTSIRIRCGAIEFRDVWFRYPSPSLGRQRAVGTHALTPGPCR